MARDFLSRGGTLYDQQNPDTMNSWFRDGKVELKPGELFVVPKGVEHRPSAEKECEIMLVEPAGTINTGDTDGDLTAEDNVWI